MCFKSNTIVSKVFVLNYEYSYKFLHDIILYIGIFKKYKHEGEILFSFFLNVLINLKEKKNYILKKVYLKKVFSQSAHYFI
jgi:hypothetical protein